jgi:hypothetical protein
VVKELLRVKLSKPQLWKALSLIVVTELGMVNEPVKPLQFQKAPWPIVVKEFPRVREPVKPLQ